MYVEEVLDASKARLIILRHGTTAWSSAGQFSGHTDIPLDVHGHQQAKQAAKTLALIRPCGVVRSDLIRAKQTAT